MKKNLRITIGCLGVLVVLLIFGLTIWWMPRRPTGSLPNYGDDSPPAVR